MGITGTEVTKDAAEMILTDDNFATIVTAVEGGRALYDNLMKYVRVQMIMLAGFILTFVGAGIWTIVGGTPITPMQILWINFAVDVPLAFGLGFDAPTPGLMKRPPRPSEAPVIARAMAVRLGITGVMIAVATLIVVSWAEPASRRRCRDDHGIHHVVDAAHRRRVRMAGSNEEYLPWRVDRQRTIQYDDPDLIRSCVPRDHHRGPAAHARHGSTSGDQWRPCLIAIAGFVVFAEIEKVIARAIAPDKPKPLVQVAVA